MPDESTATRSERPRSSSSARSTPSAVGDRQMFDLAEPELDVFKPTFVRVAPGFAEHIRGHIDPNHAPLGANLRGGQEAVETTSGAKINDHFARFERRNRFGVTAAKPHVGTLRDRRQIVFAIAKAGRDQHFYRDLI